VVVPEHRFADFPCLFGATRASRRPDGFTVDQDMNLTRRASMTGLSAGTFMRSGPLATSQDQNLPAVVGGHRRHTVRVKLGSRLPARPGGKRHPPTCTGSPELDSRDGSFPVTADGIQATAEGASRQAIEHHYDVGRDFFRLWLDARMVYSCALWPGELDDDLEAAQVAKLDWHATAARADSAPRVLDVGCGWGAMMRYLVAERHVGHVTGLTLSSDQLAAVPASDHAEVRLEDWRDHRPPRPYTAIVSIGAFEHFARPELSRDRRRRVYRSFFDRCALWLVEGGRLSLQSIAYEDFDPSEGPVSSFFTDEIFPESALPQLSDIIEAAEGRFRLVAFRSDPEHYSQTLRLWQKRLETNQVAASDLVGRETYRRYLRYLRVSRAMFDRRVCTLYRMVFERRPAGARTVGDA
jgi:cyclopropane-fatty-acyl-phospholipid synthase